MPQVSKETASQIAVAQVKRQKSTEKIDVATVEDTSEDPEGLTGFDIR